ncbi:MAG: MarR family transcriptional regulator [Chloroflexi bacterium]|nr:MarR family transcriptional regulator [Chloroflexota bacterium]MBT7080003.1 MarR family transcriptional regulator [Chloroflexota bacterium]MBT7289224.1 MarR family transcriptional regulator [Chloroflexota bacterium]
MGKKVAIDNYPLWVALMRTHYFLRKLREKELKKIGLSMAQSTVLAIIHSTKNTQADSTPAEISKQLLKAPSTTTELIDRMVEQGMVRKVQDLERRNMVRVEMTELGEELHSQSRQVEYFSKIFSKVTPRRRQSLITYLDTLGDAAIKTMYKNAKRLASLD